MPSPAAHAAPTGHSARRLLAEQLGGAVGGLLLVVLLHRLDLAGTADLWLLCLTSLTATAVSLEPVHRAMAGGDLTRRIWPRVFLHMAAVAWTTYVSGWGPLAIGIYAAIALLHIRWSGARAWLPAVVSALVCIALAQTAVALGWVYSYLPSAWGHVGAVIQALVMTLLLQYLGGMVAARERAESQLASEERRFRKIANNSSDLTILADGSGRIEWVSPSVWHLLGRSPEDLVGHRLETLLDPTDRPLAARLGERMHEDPSAPHRLEWRVLHPDATTHWYDVVVENLLHDPDVRSIVINQRDVTEARLARDRLAHEATHDNLTGLKNRAGFMQHLLASLDRLDHDGTSFALLYVDLNAFKPINDTLGHEAGDAVLKAVAQALTDAVLGADVAARLGGDEFAVLLTTVDSPRGAEIVARRVSDRIRSPLEISGQVLVPSASIGLVTVNDSELDAKDVLRRADLAMYHAKNRNEPWASYTEDLEHHGTEPEGTSRSAASATPKWQGSPDRG